MAIIKNMIFLLTFSIVWFIIGTMIHFNDETFDRVTIKFHNQSHHIDLSNMKEPKEVITNCYGFICKVSIKHFDTPKQKKRNV